jgi:hypothetical protein
MRLLDANVLPGRLRVVGGELRVQALVEFAGRIIGNVQQVISGAGTRFLAATRPIAKAAAAMAPTLSQGSSRPRPSPGRWYRKPMTAHRYIKFMDYTEFQNSVNLWAPVASGDFGQAEARMNRAKARRRDREWRFSLASVPSISG